MRFRRREMFWGVSLLLLLGTVSLAAESVWLAGASQVNITPQRPMWMGGYAKRTEPANGKLTDLWAKALVLDDGSGTRAVLITADLIAVDREVGLAIRRAVGQRFGLPLRSVALNVSHTHSGPVVGNVLAPQQRLTRKQHALVEQYASRLPSRIVELVAAAMDQLAPCQIAWGVGNCGFAVNRRENREQEVVQLRREGKLAGPVDHRVPVLKITRPEDRLLAIVFGYACHATVTGENQWSGDYPGFAQLSVQRQFPEAVAMFWAGCGADQNPLPRRSVQLASAYGRQLGEAVAEVVQGEMQPLTGRLVTAYREVPLKFGGGPTKEEIVELLNHRDHKYVNWAQDMLTRLARGWERPEHYPYPVQLWQIGDGPTWVFLGGEVVVDYALRLDADLRQQRTWVAGYSNDVMNYIPSHRVFEEGGYEGLTGMFSYGRHAPWTSAVETTICAAVEQLARQTQAISDRPTRPSVRRIPEGDPPSFPAAVVVDDGPLIHTAMLLPLSDSGRPLGGNDERQQLRYLLGQLERLLSDSGSSLGELVKLNVYAASAQLVPQLQAELLAAVASPPAATFVAGRLPQAEALVALDAVAVAPRASQLETVQWKTVPRVYQHGQQSQLAILPAGEKIFLSGWIHRGEDDLAAAVDQTLAFQVKLLERLGGELDGVVQIRAFMKMEQYDTVRDRVSNLFGDGRAVPPVVYAPWSREGPPEIELIAAGRRSTTAAPRVAYFNVPDRPPSPVFSRAARVNAPQLVYTSGLVSTKTGDADRQVRNVFAQLKQTLQRAGSDLRHMAKATYWLADRPATQALGAVRRELYDPQRPPAASAFLAQSVGFPDKAVNLDIIAVVKP